MNLEINEKFYAKNWVPRLNSKYVHLLLKNILTRGVMEMFLEKKVSEKGVALPNRSFRKLGVALPNRSF